MFEIPSPPKILLLLTAVYLIAFSGLFAFCVLLSKIKIDHIDTTSVSSYLSGAWPSPKGVLGAMYTFSFSL